MKHSRFSEGQTIAVLKENEVGARVDELFCRQEISTATFYAWPRRFRGMDGPALELLSGSAPALTAMRNPEISGYPRL